MRLLESTVAHFTLRIIRLVFKPWLRLLTRSGETALGGSSN